MSTRDVLAAALDHIEGHLGERLTLASVSAAVYVSPSHLRRLFLAIAGRPLMAYVRLRRLARSLDTLLDTDMRVIDVAHEFGFGSEQAYIRAFRGVFGVAPGTLRRTRPIVAVCQPVDVSQLRPAGDGVIYGPEFVKVPSFRVVGRLHRISERENLDRKAARVALEFFDHDRTTVANAIDPPVYIGLTRYPAGATDWSHYLAAVLVAADGPVPPGLQSDAFPTSACARFRYAGQHSFRELSIPTMRAMYDYIGAFFHRDQTRYATDFSLFFERIETALCDDHFCQMDWLTPVIDTKMSSSVQS